VAITKQEIKKTAKLAKLAFSNNEIELLSEQITEILEHVEKINKLNLEHVSPTFCITEHKNPLRKDQTKSWMSQEEALRNALIKRDGFFSVPKVIIK